MKNDKGSEIPIYKKVSFWSGLCISIISLTLLFLQVNGCLTGFSWESIVLLLLAFLPWLGYFVSKFELSKDKISAELKSLDEAVAKAETIATAAKVAATEGVGKINEEYIIHGKNAAVSLQKQANDDPNKNMFGGVDFVPTRKLSADVLKVPGDNFFRLVKIKLESTDPAKDPLTGEVTYHLHPSFKYPKVTVPVKNNIAVKEIMSYGAFTIGAECDGGKTRLELDLADLDDGNDQFYKR